MMLRTCAKSQRHVYEDPKFWDNSICVVRTWQYSCSLDMISVDFCMNIFTISPVVML